MARESKVEEAEECEIDMTPVIDIVFNLIIFFMIVSDFSSLQLEQLQLAYADKAENPKAIAPGGKIEKILQVNIMQSGLIKVRGHPYTTNPRLKGTYPWLADFLEIEAAGYEREAPDPNNPNLSASKMRVNIRCDKEAPFREVQQVFAACQKNGIYKTSLAATKQDPSK